ncbi:hypothetical protein PCANC_28738 [Puccinia coronata f. sp. avenae]|uniref:Sec1 family protein n=1 Tax=Puccinia coronata f. sp. avenae TaxID=200324 RepID=A0A2N5RTZ0_9BASI|nr:hypothetical protein PCANC_28738 [Puccinia coronata f. sp. avenae]
MNSALRPIELIVFVVGGTTYEEARTVTLLNERLASGQGFSGPGPHPQPSPVLEFLDWLRNLAHKFPEYLDPKPGLLGTPASKLVGDSGVRESGGSINLAMGSSSSNLNQQVPVGLKEFGNAAINGVILPYVLFILPSTYNFSIPCFFECKKAKTESKPE